MLCVSRRNDKRNTRSHSMAAGAPEDGTQALGQHVGGKEQEDAGEKNEGL